MRVVFGRLCVLGRVRLGRGWWLLYKETVIGDVGKIGCLFVGGKFILNLVFFMFVVVGYRVSVVWK